jgi:hypothetical protein
LTNRCRFTKTQITQADPTKDGGRPAGTIAPESGNALWPNGFNGFYCMKHEIKHRDYLAFIKANSTVTFKYTPYPPRKDLDDPTNPDASRPWLSWSDGAALAAWAGLRPMTELEYEKALRGFRDPLPDESGYSYWGMNFGGGIYNSQPRMRVVAVNAAAGRNFKGSHGTGMLELPADWPKEDAVGIATRGGWGAPGVGFQDTFRTSNRHLSDFDSDRRAGFGWRAVRTAPVEAEWNTARNEQPEATAKSGK